MTLNTGKWAALTANDPDKLFTMRATYRRVTVVASAEDQEMLSDFYFRHFEITDEAWAALGAAHRDVYDHVADKLSKLETDPKPKN